LDFLNLFQDISVSFCHSIIFDDFSGDLGTRTYDSDQILSFVELVNLLLVPFAHHTKTSVTLLDLCTLNNAEKLVSYEQCNICFLSTHLISIRYKIKIDRPPERLIKVRDFVSSTSKTFLKILEIVTGMFFYCVKDINDKVNYLNKTLTKCYDRHAPFRDFTPRHSPAP